MRERAHCTEAPAGAGADEGPAERCDGQRAAVRISRRPPPTTSAWSPKTRSGSAEGDRAKTAPSRTFAPLERGCRTDAPTSSSRRPKSTAARCSRREPEFSSCHQCEPGLNSIKMPEQSAPDGESIVYEGFPFFPATEGERGALKENEYRAAQDRTGWQTKRPQPGTARPHGNRVQRRSPAISPARDAGERSASCAKRRCPNGLRRALRARSGRHADTARSRNCSNRLPRTRLRARIRRWLSRPRHDRVRSQRAADRRDRVRADGTAVSGRGTRPVRVRLGGALRLVNVLPGQRFRRPRVGGRLRQAARARGRANRRPDRSNAVSADGSRMFWTDLENGRLYIREDGRTTREVAHHGRCKEQRAAERTRVLRHREHRRHAGAAERRHRLRHDHRTGGQDLRPHESTTASGHRGRRATTCRGSTSSTRRSSHPQQGPTAHSRTGRQPNLYEYEAAAGAVRFIATLAPKDNHHGPDPVSAPGSPRPRTAWPR